MLTLFIIVVIFCSFNGIYSATPYEDCGSKLATIQSFDVTNCTSDPCIFIKGHTYGMNLTFKAKVPSKTASISLSGIIDGIPFPFPLLNPDACKMGVKCPVNKNDINTETISFPVFTLYSSMQFGIKIEIKADDQNEDYACVQFSAIITNTFIDWKNKNKLQFF